MKKLINYNLGILLSLVTVLLIISLFLFNKRFINKVIIKNNISEVIGNAPVCPTFTITPLLGSDTVNVKLVFENPELPVNSLVVTKTITHAIANEEFTDIILTNYTGINSVKLKVQGDGIVSWVYRPGRL
jgi:hypothetical protein